jgi:cytoskeleton-associated protein 5
MRQKADPPECTSLSTPRSLQNWKARLSAYTELTLKFSKTSGDDDPFFRPYLSADLLRSWATDTNAAAQEKGLEALCSLIRESGENSARTRGDVMGGVVDKGFISTRAGTKAKAIEVALLYIEVENDGSGVVVSFES